MTSLLFVAEIKSDEFEADMTLDGRAQEFAKNALKDLIDRSEIVFAQVRKAPE